MFSNVLRTLALIAEAYLLIFIVTATGTTILCWTIRLLATLTFITLGTLIAYPYAEKLMIKHFESHDNDTHTN